MFRAAREASLSSAAFSQSGGDIDFVEGWHNEHIGEVTADNLESGSLRDDELLAWLRKPLRPRPKIRLAICERYKRSFLDFPMSKSVFLELESSLKLHPATLPAFEIMAGTHTHHLQFTDATRTKPKTLSIILKAPQKREIANFGLSITHDFTTSSTTGILYGAKVLIRPETTKRSQAAKQYAHASVNTARSETVPTLLELIRSAYQYWWHPLLLPSLLLQSHTCSMQQFINLGTLNQETMAIERELGVTRVGRKDDDVINSQNRVHTLRVKAEELTVRINTHSTRILFTARSPEWNLVCSQLLRDLLRQVGPVVQERDAEDEMKALLDFNIGLVNAAADAVAKSSERMTLQLNVLYNLVAQMDNALNAQLAASAGRDSTSMKILAFISAIFLPGSFVAGVFSTGMFDWNKGEDQVMSSRFWIYWVVALPLTILTVVGWGLWWRVEMQRFKKNFKAVIVEDEANSKLDTIKLG